eukprot:2874172-Rhodomonas_salina.2
MSFASTSQVNTEEGRSKSGQMKQTRGMKAAPCFAHREWRMWRGKRREEERSAREGGGEERACPRAAFLRERAHASQCFPRTFPPVFQEPAARQLEPFLPRPEEQPGSPHC